MPIGRTPPPSPGETRLNTLPLLPTSPLSPVTRLISRLRSVSLSLTIVSGSARSGDRLSSALQGIKKYHVSLPRCIESPSSALLSLDYSPLLSRWIFSLSAQGLLSLLSLPSLDRLKLSSRIVLSRFAEEALLISRYPFSTN